MSTLARHLILFFSHGVSRSNDHMSFLALFCALHFSMSLIKGTYYEVCIWDLYTKCDSIDPNFTTSL